MNYTIYTDGAATMRKVNGEYVRENGGWAMIVYDGGNCRIYGEYGGDMETTNNAMELYAIYRALMWLMDKNDLRSEVTIFSDSAYCVQIFNSWVKGWEKNGWTRGRKHEPIENLTAIQNIYRLLKNMPNVKIQKVKGHATCVGNNLADKYAVQGKQEATSRGQFFDVIK